MEHIEINGKKIGPYEGIMKSDGSIVGDILPIIYDNSIIDLYENSGNRFSLCYKKSKNLFGKEIKYADIVNENSGETFSLQTDNIFAAITTGNDINIVCKIGEQIKMYSNFGKLEYLIESDGDKNELTPLGYHDIFVRYDNDFYYPVFLGGDKNTEVKKFIDYYGYKSYEDEITGNHLVMLIEIPGSTENYDIWHFVDNFNIISERIDFGNDEEYVDTWELNDNLDIIIKTTKGRYFHIFSNDKKLREGKIEKKENTFSFTRFFEDTDSDFIIGKNDNGLFIINRIKTSLDNNKIKELVYFKDFITSCIYNDFTFFLLETFDNEIVIVNENQAVITYTDLHNKTEIKNMNFLNENLIEIFLTDGSKRQYII